MALITLLNRLEKYLSCKLHSKELISEECFKLSRSYANAYGNLLTIQQASTNWRMWEALVHRNVEDTLRAMQDARFGDKKLVQIGPILPFTSLMLPLTMETRLAIAEAVSLQYSYRPFNKEDLLSASISFSSQPLLRIGFISFDFNDHPTAHLVETIFNITTSYRDAATPHPSSSPSLSSSFLPSTCRQVYLVIYNYGKGDQSPYSLRLQRLADRYVDLSALSFAEAAEVIRVDDLHVLLDMQLHTLGNRLEITATRPAPLLLNYLVYPGTSGAPFLDAIVVDAVVAPVEWSSAYSEALLLLPPSYQVSIYDDVAIKAEKAAVLRKENVLPLDYVEAARRDYRRCSFQPFDLFKPAYLLFSFIVCMGSVMNESSCFAILTKSIR